MERRDGMNTPPGHEERRRSRRIPLWVPLVAVSADPSLDFSQPVDTVEVSRHGCLLCAPRPFPRGARVRLNSPYTKRSATAHIIRSHPLGPQVKAWYVALELDKAEDIWNVPWRPRSWGVT